ALFPFQFLLYIEMGTGTELLAGVTRGQRVSLSDTFLEPLLERFGISTIQLRYILDAIGKVQLVDLATVTDLLQPCGNLLEERLAAAVGLAVNVDLLDAVKELQPERLRGF